MDCSAKGKVLILPDGWNKKRSGLKLLLDCDMSISAYIDNWVKQEILFLCDYNVVYSTKGLLDMLKVGN